MVDECYECMISDPKETNDGTRKGRVVSRDMVAII